MRRYAKLLAVRYDSLRTRHSYYRAVRLRHEQLERNLRFFHLPVLLFSITCVGTDFLHTTGKNDHWERI